MTRPAYVPTCHCYENTPEQRSKYYLNYTGNELIEDAEAFTQVADTVRGPVYLFRNANSWV
jgi:hypothetical protein